MRAVSDGFTLKLLTLAVLVACSAVLTGAEAAYFSLGRARLRRLAGADGEPSRSALIEHPHDLLTRQHGRESLGLLGTYGMDRASERLL